MLASCEVSLFKAVQQFTARSTHLMARRAYTAEMHPDATKEERAEALSRAKAHDLNVAAIAQEVVRLTISEAFAVRDTLSFCFSMTGGVSRV